MSKKRRSFEKGHKRKYLVIIDDTKECDRAVYWAAKRAGRTKSVVVMLRVIETGERSQQWLGVADIMQAEAMEAAKAALKKYHDRALKVAKVKIEQVIREGDPGEQILDVIDKDPDISMLVLAANPGAEGPGPIISTMTNAVGAFPIPLMIISGALTDAEIDGLS